MQSIGERLEEARKRAGISLREASEATKIRPDYLQLMEGSNFGFPLPDVYKRGFLKIYGRYLKLDAEKLAADFTAQALGGGRGGRREGREHLGEVNLPGREAEAPAENEADPHYPGAPAGGLDVGPGGQTDDRASLVRLVVVLVLGAVAVVGLVFFLQHLMSSSSALPEEDTPTQAGTPAPTPSPATGNTSAMTTPPATTGSPITPVPVVVQLKFTAKDDLSNLTLRERAGGREIFNGPLARGKSVNATGPVEVQVTAAENLLVETNGTARVLGNRDGTVLTGPRRFYWPPDGFTGR